MAFNSAKAVGRSFSAVSEKGVGRISPQPQAVARFGSPTLMSSPVFTIRYASSYSGAEFWQNKSSGGSPALGFDHTAPSSLYPANLGLANPPRVATPMPGLSASDNGLGIGITLSLAESVNSDDFAISDTEIELDVARPSFERRPPFKLDDMPRPSDYMAAAAARRAFGQYISGNGGLSVDMNRNHSDTSDSSFGGFSSVSGDSDATVVPSQDLQTRHITWDDKVGAVTIGVGTKGRRFRRPTPWPSQTNTIVDDEYFEEDELSHKLGSIGLA